jgi:arabinogalactan endo-1,4-beta-galactosidase
VRLIPTKKDIAFVEFLDETSSGVAKDALHNYKLDGENKIKVRIFLNLPHLNNSSVFRLHLPGNNGVLLYLAGPLGLVALYYV